MKILIQCNYDPNNMGGIEAVTRHIISVTKSMDNLSVSVFASTEYDLKVERPEYSFIGSKIIRKIKGTPLLKLGNLRFTKEGLKSDVIVFQEPFPTLLPSIFLLRFLFRKKVIILVHAIPHMPGLVGDIYSRVRRAILDRCEVVATTPTLLNQLKLSDKFERHVIPLCLDESAISLNSFPASIADDISQIPNKYVLFLGRLAGYKGIDILLKSITDLPSVNFVIAGDGIMRDVVDNFIKISGAVNLSFIGRAVTDAEKHHLIERCYCFVLPSTNTSEAFAIVQLEAMLYSKPIINTDLRNGVNYVAPSKVAAVTISPSSSSELTDAINKIWSDEDLAATLGASGYSRFKELFSQEKFNSSWKGILEKLSSKSA